MILFYYNLKNKYVDDTIVFFNNPFKYHSHQKLWSTGWIINLKKCSNSYDYCNTMNVYISPIKITQNIILL